MNTLTGKDNIEFLYDYSMKEFVMKFFKRKSTDLMLVVTELETASRSFLWYFGRLFDEDSILGYNLYKKQDGQFKIVLVFSKHTTEVRAPWVFSVGKIVERCYDFNEDGHLHIPYEPEVYEEFKAVEADA